jgi:histidyl-tRNA synthetase
MNVKKLKGFRDILPEETPVWRRVEAVAAKVFGGYGFEEIRLPLLEETPLFKRSIGEATDIVEKEMYTFSDPGDTSVTLRPEGTASAVRAYVENGLARSNPKTRWYYTGPMFRRERPQKGRFRQFHQIGAECFGWREPAADADVLCMLWDLFAALGLSDRISLEINSLGCAEDRARYVSELKEFLAPRQEALCENCRRRSDRNPLRVLDCKSEGCRAATADAPVLSAALCPECEGHFSEVRRLLDGEGVPYRVNPRMVRGLDYYNRTTFELVTGELGAQNAVAAGGRYDGLVETLGGPSVPALGFALGVERLVLMLGEATLGPSRPAAYFVCRGPGALDRAMAVRRRLALSGIRTDVDFEPRSFKAQFRSADASGARFAVVIAESEVAEGVLTVKDLQKGEQWTLPVEDAVALISAACGQGA